MRRRHFVAAAAVVSVTTLAGAGYQWLHPDHVMPRVEDIRLPATVRTLAARVSPGATLSSLLHAQGLAEREVAELVSRAASVFDVRRLRSDRPYRIIRAIKDGAVRAFEYEIDTDHLLRVSRSDDAETFVATIADIDKRSERSVVAGAIDGDVTSLFGALSRAGERVDLSIALADVLSSEVDFNTELQPGDQFRLLVDKQYRADDVSGTDDVDTFANYGSIHAVAFENDGRTIQAFRFTPTGGKPDYYDANGHSLRRFFLKSPLKFDPVITSGFSMSRMHPVLGRERAHLGVDYRAPVGAPVVAVSDGLVVSAGWSGGAGQMVRLRHANGYETEYLHLSAIGVRSGARVHQGDVIGKVGATGLATGPHLDYRIMQNGTFMNPVTAHRSMPPGDPLVESDLPAFAVVRDEALKALGTTVAAPTTRSSAN